MNKIIITALIVVASTSWAQQAAPSAASSTPSTGAAEEKVVAYINGEKLTAAELDLMYSRISPQMRENYERSGGKLQFLDQYINKRLVLQEALKSRFDKRPDIAAELQAARDSTLFDRYVREVVASEVISDKELHDYYVTNKALFSRHETIKARHIIATPTAGNVSNTTGDDAASLAAARLKLENLKKQLDAGASFAELAAAYSEDGSAASGGDLGWFARGKMVPEFDAVVFKLEPGKVSDVFETQFGYHIVVVDQKKPGGVAPFAEVREEIRERFLNERASKVLEQLSALTRDLRNSSSVTINRENL